MTQETYNLQAFILEEIRRRNLSMREFAKKLDIAPSTLSRILDVQHPTNPTIETLVKLAELTNVSLETLTALAYPDLADRTKLTPTARLVGQKFEELPQNLKDAILAILRGTELT